MGCSIVAGVDSIAEEAVLDRELDRSSADEQGHRHERFEWVVDSTPVGYSSHKADSIAEEAVAAAFSAEIPPSRWYWILV